MTRDLKFEATYPFPIETVWAAIAESEQLAQWLMPNDFQPRVGHRFHLQPSVETGFAGKISCEVVEIDPPHRLAYRWDNDKLKSVVSFTLESTKDGTRLVLEHTGITPTDVSAILSNGWKKKVEQSIPALLAERHSGHPAIEEPPTAGATSALIDRYERGAAALTHALAAIPPDSLDFAPAANAWSARQIAMHIVDAEIVGAERLRMLIAQPHPLLKAYSGDIWSEKLNYAAQPLEPALELFQALRRVTTLLLRSLPADAWARQGVHEETGKLSLAELLASHCEHAEAHLTEIAEIAAKLELAAGSK